MNLPTPDRNEMSSEAKRLNNRRGAVLALVAVSMLAIMGILVLGIDGGTLQRQRRMAQTAADAGALGGAVEKFRARPGFVTATALNESARNGFANGANGVTVTVTDNIPGSGNFTGPNYVRVVVQQSVPMLLAGIFGSGSVSASSTGVAGLENAANCLVILEPSGPNALSYTAQSSLDASGCGIAVNSTSNTPVNVGRFMNAATMSVSGNQPNPGINGTWVNNAPPTSDPLGYLAPPTTGPCTNGSYGVTTVKNANLSPGVYCGGLDISGNVNLRSGVYVVAGGGIQVSKATVTCDAGGVLIINTNAPAANGGASFSLLDLFQSDITLSALQTNSPVPGAVFYSNPAVLPSAPVDGISVHNSSNLTLSGTVYMPAEQFSTKNNTDVTITGGLVARTIDAKTGRANFVINNSSGSTSLRRPTLVR